MSFRWTDALVRTALGLNPRRVVEGRVYGGICTDSRSVEAGDLFLALVGDRFDGHDFVAEALSRGAAGAVVSREVAADENILLYPVPDTLHAYGRLALLRRNALDVKVVGITGSSGKTTTKDLLLGAVKGSFRVHATPGNLNNRIGLPKTILDAPLDTDLLILEMGTNEPGEIQALTEVARPHIGLITTVSETHLEKLGSLDGVLEEKLDLFRGLPTEGTAVVGDEPPILEARALEIIPDLKVAGWSQRANADLRPTEPEVTEHGCYRFRWGGENVRMKVPGKHSVQNALLALAVAMELGIPPKAAARRIGKVESRGMRSEIRVLGTLTLLVDCYNANPQSVGAAMDLLSTVQQLGPRVAVLGSMLELGEESRILHRTALEEALSCPVDLIIATGLFADAVPWISPRDDGPELMVAAELTDAQEILMNRLGGTEVVLLKASRGVAMESLLPALEDRFGTGKAA